MSASVSGHPTTAPMRGTAASTRLIIASSVGNALEFYEILVYGYFAVTISKVFFPAANEAVSILVTLGTFGISFLARPVGAIFLGAYGDRKGRKRALTLSILLMTIGTGVMTIMPSYNSVGLLAPLLVIAARLLQGFSTGGEMGPATTYLLESAPLHRKCFFGSWQLASQNMGSIFSGLVGLLLSLLITPEATDSWGWRVPFLLGILIAPVGYYIRSNLDETMNAEEAHGSMRKVLADVVASHWQKILLCILLISGATITQYFFLYTTTYAINTLHYSQGWAMAANMATGITGMVFAVAGGALADRVGVRVVVLLPRLIATVLLYPVLHLVVSSGSPLVLVIAMAGLMAIHAMTSAAGIVLIPMIFPAAVRTSALSIAYALGVTIFGGTAQLVFTGIIEATGDKLSWVWYVIAMGLVSFLGTLAIRTPESLGGKRRTAQPDSMLAGVSN